VPDAHDPDGREAWAALFPACKHVFMTRRNKVRLAVSWWRAIRSGEWHRPGRPAPTVVDPPSGHAERPKLPQDVVDLYDYNALAHLFAEASLREAAMQNLFDRWRVIPYTIVYEDLIAAYEPTMRGLLDFLEIPDRHTIEIPAPAFEQLADEISNAWTERFVREWKARK
jgi:trehalose 2-sulfotransferase